MTLNLLVKNACFFKKNLQINPFIFRILIKTDPNFIYESTTFKLGQFRCFQYKYFV